MRSYNFDYFAGFILQHNFIFCLKLKRQMKYKLHMLLINKKITGEKYIKNKVNDDVMKYINSFIIEEDIKKYYKNNVMSELKQIIYPKITFGYIEQLIRVRYIQSYY